MSWFRNQLMGTMSRNQRINLVPSIVVELPDHHDFDVALKSPKITAKAVTNVISVNRIICSQ